MGRTMFCFYLLQRNSKVVLMCAIRGFNNVFHVRTGKPLAILYNGNCLLLSDGKEAMVDSLSADRSVLENHHVAASFALLNQEQYNFIKALSDDQ